MLGCLDFKVIYVVSAREKYNIILSSMWCVRYMWQFLAEVIWKMFSFTVKANGGDQNQQIQEKKTVNQLLHRGQRFYLIKASSARLSTDRLFKSK